jgi:hypothetical protein
VAIEKEISKKESLLKQAKGNSENELAAQLEQQIQELKSQEENNLSVENPNKTAIYLTIGLVTFSLIGLVFLIAKLKGRKTKNKL